MKEPESKYTNTYNLILYPPKTPPKLGEMFVVSNIQVATDMHWGECFVVELRRIRTNYAEIVFE